MKTEEGWTFEQGVEFVRRINEAVQPVGFHCALCGSVLHKGASDHDLDMVIFPMTSALVDLRALHEGLRKQGLTLRASRSQTAGMWERKGSLDQKNVEVWKTPEGKRVDIFHLR